MTSMIVSHTAGPWHISGLDPHVIGPVRVLSIPAMEATTPQLLAVARVMDRNGETAANANLIAAAPDLLSACKAAMWAEPGYNNLLATAIARAEGGPR